MVSYYSTFIVAGLLLVYLESWLYETLPKRAQLHGLGCLLSAVSVAGIGLTVVGIVGLLQTVL